MKYLDIDIETYSSADLKKCGVYRYSEDDDFEILLFGYSADGGEPVTVDLIGGERIPEDVIEAITDMNVLKYSYNAQFERICLSKLFRGMGILKGEHDYLSPIGWRCSMVRASSLGLPRSLAEVGRVLDTGNKKLSDGTALIKYFCVPCKPTTKNGGRTRNYPRHWRAGWENFKYYNQIDVLSEAEIREKLSKYPEPEGLWEEYCIDQEINDRGVRIDTEFVRNAIEADRLSHAEIMEKLRELTGLENPGSVTQLKSWLSVNGISASSINKDAVAELLESAEGNVAEVLRLRQQAARSSTKQYERMLDAVCSDERARGMFMFMSATRTGRWAGRIIQLQNLPRNSMKDLEDARLLVKHGNYNVLKHKYDNIPDVLSQLIRTSFIPEDGKLFYVSDFAQIEARVIAWLAGEQWRMKVFEENGDIYSASASKMFHVPVEKNGVNGELRQKGKIAELALGFGGGFHALQIMGAEKMGIPEEELQEIVDEWRMANPNIANLWYDIEEAATNTVLYGGSFETHGIRFTLDSHILFITLPSGRKLAYVNPMIGISRFGSDCLTYEAAGPSYKWETICTYGGKLTENIVQATARDILCYAMEKLRDMKIVMHIHDELIFECDPGTSLDDICKKMSETPPWAEGLKLSAAGYTTQYYMKD